MMVKRGWSIVVILTLFLSTNHLLLSYVISSPVIAEAPVNTFSGNADSWPMFRHDGRHTGSSDSSAPKAGKIVWMYQGDAGSFSSPAVRALSMLSK
jgi:hypothetical protein